MLKYKIVVPWAVVLFLLIVIFLQREFNRIECPEVRVDTAYIFDMQPYTPMAITPKLGVVVPQVPPAVIDSFAVTMAYFAVRQGTDTLVNDDRYLISLRWAVTQNTPTFFQPTIINRLPTTIISHTPIEKPKNKYYGGFEIQGNKELFGFGPAIVMQTKKDHLYKVSYDMINKTFLVGTYWKIKFK